MLREESEGLGERNGEKLEGIKETESGESKMGRDRQSKTKMEERRREKDEPPPKKKEENRRRRQCGEREGEPERITAVTAT